MLGGSGTFFLFSFRVSSSSCDLDFVIFKFRFKFIFVGSSEKRGQIHKRQRKFAGHGEMTQKPEMIPCTLILNKCREINNGNPQLRWQIVFCLELVLETTEVCGMEIQLLSIRGLIEVIGI